MIFSLKIQIEAEINLFFCIIYFKLLVLSIVKKINNFQILLHCSTEFKIRIKNLLNILLNLGSEFFCQNLIIMKNMFFRCLENFLISFGSFVFTSYY